jgi:protein involved in polysaccharide export with SLBB domain
LAARELTIQTARQQRVGSGSQMERKRGGVCPKAYIKLALLMVLGAGGAGAQVAVPAGGASSTGAAGAADHSAIGAVERSDLPVQAVSRTAKPQGEFVAVAASGTQPTEFQRMVAASAGEMPPIFGADLFRGAPSTFAPVDNVPVTPDYTIGPGDELRVQVWGEVDQRGSYVVDRTGAIAVPEIGTLHVAGLRFSQVTPFLKSQLQRVYRNFDINVNLGQLRSIQIFVTGQARQPGSYTIGSMSTLLNALFAAGGPLPEGSLRDIQLKRDGQTVTHFDLYDMILHGDKSKDVRLEPGDLIFIPDVGPQVAVMGSVRTPAVYELREEKSFLQVIALAGGETNTASAGPVRVERIYQHMERSGIDIDLGREGSAPVQDGDILLVRSIAPRFEATVTLRGNVAQPGRRTWHTGMRVSDLIPDSQALVTQDYYDRQNQLGLTNRDAAGAGTEGSLSLQAGGGVRAGASPEAASAGEALTRGNNRFRAKTDVLLSAPEIDWNYAVIERQSDTKLTTTLLPFNLGDVVLRHDAAQDLPLLPGDVVTIFSTADIRVPSAQQTKFVKLEGEFVNAGVYSVLPGETLRQLLVRVGGLTPEADLFASQFTRESVQQLQRERLLEYANMLEAEATQRTAAERTSAVGARDMEAAQASEAAARAVVAQLRQQQPSGRIVMRLTPESQGVDAVSDMALEDGDRFLVPKAPSYVNVTGNVSNPSTLEYFPGQRVKDYIALAGSPNRAADKSREFILRANGAVVSRFNSHDRGGRFDDLVLYPGDTIIVPPKYVKGSLTRDLLNISAIFEGFGLGAAAINLLH